MKKIILALTLFFTFLQINSAQKVVSSTFLISYDLDYFTVGLQIPFSKNGVDLYRINYTTTNLEGALDTASGLLCIPQIEGYNLPLVSYDHGTVGSRYAVPSYLSPEHTLPAIYSSVGTVTIAPDYLGLGDNDGIHPYVHANSEASASYDMIVAVKDFLPMEMDINLNDQLFITGYSQGGHAAMALHRYIETETDLVVTGALPMSGPYSISSGMKDLLITNDEYEYVAYLVATAISYQEAYGTIYPNNDITQFFKQPYADIIQKYITEEIDLFEINAELVDSLIANEGGAFPKKMIIDDIVNAIITDDNHPVNVALRDNDVYDWAPVADTRLLYCEGDDQVAFENSIIARDKMVENGAQMVTAIDLNSALNHTECVTPAATSFVLFLLVFSEATATSNPLEISWNVYPNPSSSGFQVLIDDLSTEFNAEIYNMSGVQEMKINSLYSGGYINPNLPAGMYILTIKDKEGRPLGNKRIVIL